MFKKINIMISVLLFQILSILLVSGIALAAPVYSIVEDPGGSNVPDIGYSIKEIDDGGNEATFIAFQSPSGTVYFRPDSGGPANGCVRIIFNVIGNTSGTLINCAQPGDNTLEEFQAYVDSGDALAINFTSSTFDPVTGQPITTGAETTPTCESSTSGGIGWIMCAGVNTLVGAVNWFADIIGYFLRVSPVVPNDAGGEPTSVYQGWNAFKNISLVLLVVASLVAVFGQTFGMEAYAIKKMLPRIIIASIAILLSYSIVALLVDLFNVLGSGIHNFLINTLDASIEVDFASFITTTLATLLVGGAATGGGLLWVSTVGFSSAAGTVALFVLLPLFLAILGVFFTLIFRQILIIMLIILSPLAMLAWILPNTEKYFKLWWDTTLKALLMYPLIMILITSGQIYASIITSGDTRGPANLIVALLAVTIPLFLVPMTFRFAGSAVAGASNWVKNASAKGAEYAKGDRQDPNSLRNKLDAERVYKQSEYGRKGRFKNLTNSKYLRGTPLGTNSLKHATAQAQKIARAQSLLDGVAKSSNGRAVETMIFGDKVGIKKVDPRTGRLIPAASGSGGEIALGKSMREDPEVYSEGYAMSLAGKVSSEADLLQYMDALDEAPSKVDKSQTYMGATRRPIANKLGINRTIKDASQRERRVVYDWEKSSVSGRTAAERRDGSTEFIDSTSKLKPWELAGHSAISFESLSNYVDYAREFGREEEMTAITRMASQIAEGAGTYTDPDTGEERHSNPATIEVQKAARKFVDKAELAGFGPKLGPAPPGYGTTPSTPTGTPGGRRGRGGGTTSPTPATSPPPTGGTPTGGGTTSPTPATSPPPTGGTPTGGGTTSPTPPGSSTPGGLIMPTDDEIKNVNRTREDQN